MTSLLQSITKALSNPKIQKFILYILIALFVLWLLSQTSEKFAVWFKKFKLPSGNNVFSQVDESRKQTIEDISDGIKKYLDSNPISSFLGAGSNAEAKMYFNAAYNLPDNELYYLHKYYKSTNGKTLYKDIDEETMPSSWDIDVKLLQRLKAMNLV